MSGWTVVLLFPILWQPETLPKSPAFHGPQFANHWTSRLPIEHPRAREPQPGTTDRIQGVSESAWENVHLYFHYPLTQVKYFVPFECRR